MKYIVVMIFLLHVNLFASVFSFEELRDNEKELVLEEFKKLYKIRKNIHQNMRQVLKHARSKNLHKKHLSFFQAKGHDESYPMELSNVFASGETPTCEADCQTVPSSDFEDSSTNIDEIASQPISPEQEISGGMPEIDTPTEIIPEKESSGIRDSVTSPWAKR